MCRNIVCAQYHLMLMIQKFFTLLSHWCSTVFLETSRFILSAVTLNSKWSVVFLYQWKLNLGGWSRSSKEYRWQRWNIIEWDQRRGQLRLKRELVKINRIFPCSGVVSPISMPHSFPICEAWNWENKAAWNWDISNERRPCGRVMCFINKVTEWLESRNHQQGRS